jgi:hypothetical protein
MPKVILDFTEAVEINRDPVPAGVYRATIDATYAKEIKTGKAKGTPYVSLGFSIVSPEEYAGRMVFNNYMLAGPGAGNTKSLLRVLGLYADSDGNMFQVNTDELHGYEVIVRVKERALDDGTIVNDVVAVTAAPHVA